MGFLVVVGAICSLFFSFNWGFTLFDVVDNYLNVYLMLVVGMLEVMGVGWIYEFNQVAAQGRNYLLAIIILTVGFWTGVVVIPVAAVFSESEYGWVGLVAFWAWMLIVWAVSFFVSKVSFGEWLSAVAFTGVRKLSRTMSKLSKKQGDTKQYWWENVFEIWWNFSIKYFVPFALSFLLFNSLKNDIENPYGEYHILWQCVGFVFPIAGLLVFFISLFACKEVEENFSGMDGVFDPNDRVGTGAESSYAAGLKGDEAPKSVQEAELEAARAREAELTGK